MKLQDTDNGNGGVSGGPQLADGCQLMKEDGGVQTTTDRDTERGVENKRYQEDKIMRG